LHQLPLTSLDELLPIRPGQRTLLPILDLPGEAKVVAASMDAGVEVPPHVVASESTLLLLKGAIEFRIDTTTHELHPGQFLKVPGNTTHSVRAIEPSRFIVLQAHLERE
jgi:quercetin dioxygenase-like cupin family protein